jgi:ribosomal protein L37AE/L43A
MAKARKATLVCRPCDTEVIVTDLGAAIVECYKCGMELEPSAKAPRKALAAQPAKKKLPAKKAAAGKPVAKKAAPKKRK